MAAITGFTITKNGNWPEEKYTITLDGNVIDPSLAKLPAENLFRFENSYLLPINFISNFDYINASAEFDSEGLLKLDTFSNTSLVWIASAERPLYNSGNRFSSFNIDLKNGAPQPAKFCSYLLYPQKLFLKPTTKPYKSGNNWVIETETILLDYRAYSFIKTDSPDEGAAIMHLSSSLIPQATSILPSNTNYSIVYNLSTTRTRVERPIIYFTSTYNPSNYTIVLEPVPSSVTEKSVIRPDTTFVSYNIDYYFKDNTTGVVTFGNLGQARPDVTPGLTPTLKSSYVVPSSVFLGTQFLPYQLLQMKQDGNPAIPLGDSRYCVLSAVFNTQDTNFTYYNKNIVASNGTIVNWTTGVPDTFIGVSYIADCPVLQYTNERWQDTLISTGSTELGSLIPTESVSNITWTTKYPPHYYSYKASLVNESSPNTLMETSHLTFYLNSEILSGGYTTGGYTTSFSLSTYIHSDYNFIKYDLWNGAPNDYIKFSPTVNSNSIFLSSLCCYYGDNLNVPYSLIDTPWIPASSANNFIITYPDVTHGELDFSLRPSLCSLAGQMDAFRATRINLAIGQLPSNKGNKIFLTKLKEQEDYVEIDSSFLISDSSWPGRDLNGSYITWDATPTSSYLKLFSINNTTGQFIQNITPNTAYLFNNSTYTIAVSGFGPTTTVITLSSQKYNETTTLSTNSALFDFFAEGLLLVGPSVPLNNLNEIRTITLTAAVPYKGRTYPLPYETQMDWSWTYNNIYDYAKTPVSAYYYKNSDIYSYGNSLGANTLSSIYFEIQPAYSNTTPVLNKVSIIASVDTQSKLLQGVYDLSVDDFPSRNLLNTYFSVKYKNYPDVIVDTTNGTDVITRKHDDTNTFVLDMNSDYTGDPNADIKWYVNNNVGGVVNEYSVNASNNIDLNLNDISVTKVSISAINVIVAGWTYPHSIASNCTFYILDSATFNIPMEFISFPEFFWKPNENKLTLLDNTNYNILSSNSVFGNKKSNTQGFYLSSNKSDFTKYYYSTPSYTKFNTLSSDYQLTEVPYSTYPTTVANQIPLTLTAYNDTSFPEKNGITYLAPVGGVIKTLYFNNFSSTDNSSINILKKPPTIIPYTNTINSFVVQNTSLDLDVNRTITVTQKITSDSIKSPVSIVNGTVTYILSSQFWTIYKTIGALDGTYQLFNLLVGDPLEVRTVTPNKTTTLMLYSSSDIDAKIYPSTFSDYTTIQYPKDRDLWNTINQKSGLGNPAYIKTTSNTAASEIFISTTYTLTGDDIYVQYETPDNTDPEFNIVAYATDFGEVDSTFIHAYDQTIRYRYNNIGTYYISTTAFYQNNTIKATVHPNPVFIKNVWDVYDPNDLRFVEETVLSFPYEREDVLIQPNQWGEADIFNTSILRIQENLDYLKSNLKTLDTLSPTVFFGWLGFNIQNVSGGLRWHTKDFLSEFYLSPLNATSKVPSYTGSGYLNIPNNFNNIIDAVETKNHIFVLHDKNSLLPLSAGHLSPVLTLENLETLKEILLTPTSIEINEDETSMFACDSTKNKIYKFDLELNITNPTFNYSTSLGGLGADYEPNKFNSPSELVYCSDTIYVLDYNNLCIKQFNSNLSWVHTYVSELLNQDPPILIAIHPTSLFLYVLTKSNTVYVYEQYNNIPIGSFKLKSNTKNIIKIIFDEVGDFMYVVTKTDVYKYSPSGYFISLLILPDNLTFVGAKRSYNRSILLFTSNCIIKIQDILKTHEVGRGLPKQYWSKEELSLKRTEFSSDMNYNRALIRIAQNLKTFRNTINYKLAIVTEEINTSLISYLATVPVSIDELPVFDEKIENETIGIGINELHTPQVVNRELKLLYDSLNLLKAVFDIETISSDKGNGCSAEFCWSWSATSCHKLTTFPVLKVCSINPITYGELDENLPVIQIPSSKWKDAISECCQNVDPLV